MPELAAPTDLLLAAFNHACMCLCVVSVPEIPPTPALQTQNAQDCATLTIYAETINARTKQTPIPGVEPDTSQQTTETSSVTATLAA